MPKTTARRRAAAAALAAALAASLSGAAPAAAAARAPRDGGWIAAIWGGLERIFAAQGGCIDPNGVKCAAEPTDGARTALCLDAAGQPADCALRAASSRAAGHGGRGVAAPLGR